MSFFNDVKSAAQILYKAGKIKEYEQVIEAVTKISELQYELREAKEKLDVVSKELADIHDDSKALATMKQSGNSFLFDTHERPYCIRCAQVDKREDRL